MLIKAANGTVTLAQTTNYTSKLQHPVLSHFHLCDRHRAGMNLSMSLQVPWEPVVNGKAKANFRETSCIINISGAI